MSNTKKTTAATGYLSNLEESILSNIVYEVDLLRGMTSSTLRSTAVLAIITLMLFNPYTLGASAVVGAMAGVSGYILYTAYSMGKKKSGYPHFEATHMIGLLFAFPFMVVIGVICGMAGYYGVELMGVALLG